MLTPYGTVISTRILRDTNSYSKGVGFARYSKFMVVIYIWNFLHLQTYCYRHYISFLNKIIIFLKSLGKSWYMINLNALCPITLHCIFSHYMQVVHVAEVFCWEKSCLFRGGWLLWLLSTSSTRRCLCRCCFCCCVFSNYLDLKLKGNGSKKCYTLI